MENFIQRFKEYSDQRNWSYDNFTSEFTLQFRICRFLEEEISGIQIELESNINRYNIYNLIKKEIDVDILDINNHRSAIEIKYVKDLGSYNIGMYKFTEDLKFLEQLVSHETFNSGYGILFTSVEKVFTEPKKPLNPRNKENLRLYECFRVNKRLSGNMQIKTGKLKGELTLDGTYPINWEMFTPNIKACIVKIN